MAWNEYTIELFDDATGFEYDVTAEVTHFFVQKPIWNADNPDDYYGYTEMDFDIVEVIRYDSKEDGSTVVSKVNSLPDELHGELEEWLEKLALEDYEDNGVY